MRTSRMTPAEIKKECELIWRLPGGPRDPLRIARWVRSRLKTVEFNSQEEGPEDENR